jgi:DMSO/TMAO reductase YedYZ heme-binding membrane subunit
MSPEIWWYVSRASGIVAWLLLTATVIWGIVLADGLLKRRAAWLLDMHRWLGGLTVVFLGVHLVSLLADSYVQFGPLDILVPFASQWRPAAVALGIIAFWLVIAVAVTSLAVKRLPRRWWRGVHLASYATFWLTSIHGALAGTDASRPLYITTSSVALVAVVVAVSQRILSSDWQRRRRARRPLPPTAETSL